MRAFVLAALHRSVALAGILAVSSCSQGTPDAPLPVVPFATMVSQHQTLKLQGGPEVSGGLATSPLYSGLLVKEREFVLLDATRGEVRVYSRSSGMMVRKIGTPGEGTGDVRRPFAIASLDSGQFVVLDRGRNVFSFRDSLGAVLRESPLPAGFFNGLVAFQKERRLVLAGNISDPEAGVSGMDLHEFDLQGHRLASYARSDPIKSAWDRRLRARFLAGIGTRIVSGSLGSSELRFFERETGREHRVGVGSGWFKALDGPSNDELASEAKGQPTSELATAWVRQQRLMNAVIPLSGGRLLIRLLEFEDSGERIYSYVLTDTAGRTFALTEPTPIHVLAAAGDTVHWLAGGRQQEGTVFGTGVVADLPSRRQ